MLVHHTFLKFHFWNLESGNHWSQWVFDFETVREFGCNSSYHKNLTNLGKAANVDAVTAGTPVTGLRCLHNRVSLLVKREIVSGENRRNYKNENGYFLHCSLLHFPADMLGEEREEGIKNASGSLISKTFTGLFHEVWVRATKNSHVLRSRNVCICTNPSPFYYK